MTEPALRLLTVPFSHFCEKARWALDYAGLPYREDAYVPGAHVPAVKKVKGKTLPILVTPEGVLHDSTDILRFVDSKAPADRKLYPSDPAARREVDDWEELFDTQLGPDSRLVAYHHLLPRPGLLVRLMGQTMTFGQRLLFRALLPLILQRFIRKMYRINDATEEAALRRTREVLAKVGERLADGRRYLVGDRLTAADLTFASLGGPLVAPPEHPVHPDLTGLPEPLARLKDELRATPAGEFALRLYREHRRPAR